MSPVPLSCWEYSSRKVFITLFILTLSVWHIMEHFSNDKSSSFFQNKLLLFLLPTQIPKYYLDGTGCPQVLNPVHLLSVCISHFSILAATIPNENHLKGVKLYYGAWPIVVGKHGEAPGGGRVRWDIFSALGVRMQDSRSEPGSCIP